MAVHFPWLTKRGYAVRLSTGEYRGVFRDRATARMVWAMAGVLEPSCLFEEPSVVACRVRPWTRFGVRAVPLPEGS